MSSFNNANAVAIDLAHTVFPLVGRGARSQTSALVSYNSGHTDIARRNNAILIECHRPMERHTGKDLRAIWNDPSLEETIEKLEWCYHHRDELKAFGRQAATDMRQFSWHRVAEGLLQAARGNGQGESPLPSVVVPARDVATK